VTKREPNGDGRLVVGIEVGGQQFEIWMETIAGERELHVSLDRLWFWGVMKNAGLIPTINSDASSAGIDFSLKRAMAGPDILY